MSHGVMLVLATVLTTVALRVGPVVLSAMVADRPWGLLNRAWMPAAVSFGLTIVLMDLLQYGVHWSFHHVGFLWRIHRVHHSDPDFDVSTAGRFHPLEAMVTQGVHLVAVALLAPPPAAMLASLLLTAVLNLWTHANASLSAGWERVVRGALITPDLHRIHHSERMREQQTNYGQTFSCWDRLFGTFVGKAEAPEGEFRTGLDDLEGGGSAQYPVHADGAVSTGSLREQRRGLLPPARRPFTSSWRARRIIRPPDSRPNAAIPDEASISGATVPANAKLDRLRVSRVNPSKRILIVLQFPWAQA